MIRCFQYRQKFSEINRNRQSIPQPADSLFLGQPRFFPLFLLATTSPCLFPGCFSPAVSSCFRSFRPLPLNRVFLLPQRPAAASQPPLSPLRPIYPPRPPTRLAQFCVSRARRPAAPARFFSRRVLQPAPTRFFPLFLLATASPCLFPGCFSPAVSSCFRSFRPLPLNRVFLLPQRPAAASQPPLSPLSFSLRLCPACLPSIPQSAPFSLSSRRPTYTAVFLTRLPFPITFLSPYPPAAYLASLPAVSLPPCPHASAVSARCPSTASSFSRSVLPPPLNRRFLHSGGLFDALSLCPISFLQSKKTCRKHVFSFRHFFTACIPVPQQKHPACNRIHPARFRGFSAPTKPASGSICGCRKT